MAREEALVDREQQGLVLGERPVEVEHQRPRVPHPGRKPTLPCDAASRLHPGARGGLPARVLEHPARAGARRRERDRGGADRGGGRVRARHRPPLRRGMGRLAVHRRHVAAAAPLLRPARDGLPEGRAVFCLPGRAGRRAGARPRRLRHRARARDVGCAGRGGRPRGRGGAARARPEAAGRFPRARVRARHRLRDRRVHAARQAGDHACEPDHVPRAEHGPRGPRAMPAPRSRFKGRAAGAGGARTGVAARRLRVVRRLRARAGGARAGLGRLGRGGAGDERRDRDGLRRRRPARGGEPLARAGSVLVVCGIALLALR